MSEAIMPVRGPYPDSEGPALYDSGAVTPNLGLTLGHMSRAASDNFVTLDTATAATPSVQAKVTAVNTTTIQTVSLVAPATTLYAVSLFMQSPGTGAGGHTVTATITYTSPNSGTPLTITVTMQLSSANVVMETYPLLVAAGTTITLATAYGGGAVNDPYTISAKIVEMP